MRPGRAPIHSRSLWACSSFIAHEMSPGDSTTSSGATRASHEVAIVSWWLRQCSPKTCMGLSVENERCRSEIPQMTDIDSGPSLADSPHARMPAVLPTLLPGPVDWRAVFGRTAPLEVELGFGRPHFILERAREAPGSDVVGIEWKGKWPRAVWAKQAKGEA